MSYNFALFSFDLTPNMQSYVETQWKMHGKPAMQVIIEKVLQFAHLFWMPTEHLMVSLSCYGLRARDVFF